MRDSMFRVAVCFGALVFFNAGLLVRCMPKEFDLKSIADSAISYEEKVKLDQGQKLPSIGKKHSSKEQVGKNKKRHTKQKRKTKEIKYYIYVHGDKNQKAKFVEFTDLDKLYVDQNWLNYFNNLPQETYSSDNAINSDIDYHTDYYNIKPKQQNKHEVPDPSSQQDFNEYLYRLYMYENSKLHQQPFTNNNEAFHQHQPYKQFAFDEIPEETLAAKPKKNKPKKSKTTKRKSISGSNEEKPKQTTKKTALEELFDTFREEVANYHNQGNEDKGFVYQVDLKEGANVLGTDRIKETEITRR